MRRVFAVVIVANGLYAWLTLDCCAPQFLITHSDCDLPVLSNFNSSGGGRHRRRGEVLGETNLSSNRERRRLILEGDRFVDELYN